MAFAAVRVQVPPEVLIIGSKKIQFRLDFFVFYYFFLPKILSRLINRLKIFLGTDTDNAPLIVWRILWGFLLFAEGFGAIITGWVHKTFIDVQFTFTFIGLEWLQPFPGQGMHIYFGIMALLGIFIMMGYRYRLSSVLFFLMWTAVYLMQKSHYNNHYYLIVIVSFLMILVPAHADHSLDAKSGRVEKRQMCVRWNIWLFILLVGLVYITASLNKIHPDWLNALPLKIWFFHKTDYPVIGSLLGKEWMPHLIAYGAIIYDGLIFFILLHPRTRNIGFFLSVVFNLFNSAVFQIGVFPYMMISFTALFLSGETLRRIFFRKSKPPIPDGTRPMPMLAFGIFIGFFLVNIMLPLRHHLYQGDVHWTEEGHRLSWQMMLRSKSGTPIFYVENKETGNRTSVDLHDYLSAGQKSDVGVKPDMIWQFAQHLRNRYAEDGIDIAVYVKANVGLNGFEKELLIDPEVDLAAVPWERFKHSDWILDENRPSE